MSGERTEITRAVTIENVLRMEQEANAAKLTSAGDNCHFRVFTASQS
jgi:hypothetical protein